jgi:hypothetical protein
MDLLLYMLKNTFFYIASLKWLFWGAMARVTARARGAADAAAE